MLTPKYPPPDTPPPPAVSVTPVAPATDAHTPACGCHHAPTPAPAPTRPALHISPGVVVGGTAVVLIVGTVLVSMLLAVAIAGCSVAICALVIRSLINNQTGTHR